MRWNRGWQMAVAGASANFVSFGILFSFGLFLTPLADTFGTSTGRIAPLFSGSVGCYYLAGAIGGRFGDRWGPRPVVTFGAVALPLGLLLSAQATSLWQVYVFYVPLVGLAVGSCYSPLLGAVGRWFEDQRALALAVVLTGVGAGSLLMPLIIRALLDWSDWRVTFRILAALAALVLTVTSLVVVHRSAEPAAGFANPLAMFRDRRFRRLYLSVVLIAPGFYAPLLFLNDYARDQGISAGRAAALVATIGFGSVISRISFGGTAGRFGAIRQYRFSHVLFLISLVLWLVAGGSFWVLALAAVLHGLGWAAWVTAAPLVLADWFGVGDLGLLVGGFYTGLGFGAFVGPTISGLVIDQAGYRPAVALVLVTTVLSCGALMLRLEDGA